MSDPGTNPVKKTKETRRQKKKEGEIRLKREEKKKENILNSKLGCVNFRHGQGGRVQAGRLDKRIKHNNKKGERVGG